MGSQSSLSSDHSFVVFVILFEEGTVNYWIKISAVVKSMTMADDIQKTKKESHCIKLKASN